MLKDKRKLRETLQYPFYMIGKRKVKVVDLKIKRLEIREKTSGHRIGL